MGIYMVFSLLGGLGLFLYGMKLMSDGLEKIAGDRMRRVLEVLTANRFAAVGVGAAVTAIVQSSSAVTVMMVGFVNAGLMSLSQAAGVIMGANIGTIITAQLIAFNLDDIAPVVLFAGMIMVMFLKKRRLIQFGDIVLGFGMLFVGLNLMSEAMVPLQEVEAFTSFLVNFKSPIVGVFAGALFTAVIQSSSASVGILQALAIMGLIGLDSAVYVILGQNIGTCVTAIISAIGTSTNSKRTAGIHLAFNVIGMMVYMVILALFPQIVDWVVSLSPDNAARQIANFHTIFNISITILLFPVINYIVKLVSIILPEKSTPGAVEKRLIFLDERIGQTPQIVLSQTMKELSRMGSITLENFKLSLDAFFGMDEQKVRSVMDIEKTVDFLSDNITRYMIAFRGIDLSDSDLVLLGQLHHAIIDLERISDRAENIAEYTLTLIDTKEKMSSQATEELKVLSSKTMNILRLSLDIFETHGTHQTETLLTMKKEFDIMQNDYMDNHIRRLQDLHCRPHTGVVFTNMLATFERIASHAVNIAYSVDVR